MRSPGIVGSMVVSALSGGLGNQMFQYAAGRTLAARFGARLVLDATVFTLPGERRRFALSDYEVDADLIFDGYVHPPPGGAAEYPRSKRLSTGQNKSLIVALRSIVERISRRGDRAGELRVFREKSF